MDNTLRDTRRKRATLPTSDDSSVDTEDTAVTEIEEEVKRLTLEKAVRVTHIGDATNDLLDNDLNRLNRPNALWRDLNIDINFEQIFDEEKVSEVSRIAYVDYYRLLRQAKLLEDARYAKRKKVANGKAPARRPTDRVKQVLLAVSLGRTHRLLQLMEEEGNVCNQCLIFGHIPGVQIGDRFEYKSQMKLIGLHNVIMAGISYVTKSKLFDGSPPLAVSICLAGGYEDDTDEGLEMMYTGQGGNDLLGNKKQIKDQVLERGNLALYNNAVYGVPVRVIKKNDNVFIYDGLWDVLHMIKERGAGGFLVYQFRLRRCAGQPYSDARQVKFREGQGSSKNRAFCGYPLEDMICEGIKSYLRQINHIFRVDYSRGLNNLKISVTNGVDQDLPPGIDLDDLTFESRIDSDWKVSTDEFVFGIEMKIDNRISELVLPAGNEQIGEEPHEYLKRLNHGHLPYSKNGRIYSASSVLYECGSWTGCSEGDSCIYSVAAKPPDIKFQLFKTKNRGWGVRALQRIEIGSFVMKYIGDLLPVDDSGDQPDIYAHGVKRRPDYTEDNKFVSEPQEIEEKYIVTGLHYGNLFRFINHSCDPNCFVQPVCAHPDPSRPDICIFAMRTILPGEEISYDYGRNYITRYLEEGCQCGTACCTSRVVEKNET